MVIAIEQQEKYGFLEKLTMGDESTFHINGKVNKHNKNLGDQNPQAVIEHEKDSPKLISFCTTNK